MCAGSHRRAIVLGCAAPLGSAVSPHGCRDHRASMPVIGRDRGKEEGNVPHQAGVMPALIGRAVEAARISTQLEEIRAGRGAALALQGEPGIGKTALLEWAAGQADDMRVLRATGIESELELAFSGLAELCFPLLGRLDEIPAPQAGALRAAFALADGRPGDRFVLAMATASLLQAEARERPVLAVIDDAQWLDRASADALVFMLRRRHGGPI